MDEEETTIGRRLSTNSHSEEGIDGGDDFDGFVDDLGLDD
jgi:hypothetical protein